MKTIKSDEINRYPVLKKLSIEAWDARDNARLTPTGRTKVGAVVANTGDDFVFKGCNIEHSFRSHDIHAEVCAIASLSASGYKTFDTIFIVAQRDRFTPCGSCMDWIMEVGGSKAQVMFQGKPGGDILIYSAEELMPQYPF
jgi:cytidine deaminase